MPQPEFAQIQALTFDLFGTVLDLGGSLQPAIESFLRSKRSDTSSESFWREWRYRQRIEQYQDNRLIRPKAQYVGPEGVKVTPIDQRG